MKIRVEKETRKLVIDLTELEFANFISSCSEQLKEEAAAEVGGCDNPQIEPMPEPEEEAAPPQTEQKTDFQKFNHAPNEYKGFFHIKCERCGNEKTFFTRNYISKNQCSCGHTTKFIKPMKRVYINCYSCGNQITYWSNSEEKQVMISCLRCNELNIAVKDNGKNSYSTPYTYKN